MTTVVIASYFEEEYVRRIRKVDERLRVLYREDLVPPPRWPGDHAGPEEWERTPEGEEAFLKMLGEAEVLYDFPRGHVGDLVEVAPRLSWVQGSMAGAGEVVEKAGLGEADIVVTTASGIYWGADFSALGRAPTASTRPPAPRQFRKGLAAGATGTPRCGSGFASWGG